MKTPKVSVLTPLYNTNPQHLRECIESILNQTFTDFEFLILNDSPDNTELDRIVKSYQDKRIRYVKNDKNLGITPSRNKLLELACGEYIAIFDHDDVSVPHRLEKQVAYLDAHPHVGVVSGWLEYFDESGKTITIWQTPEFDTTIKANMTYNCYVAHTAAMIRRSVLTDNDIEYEEFYTPAEDYRLWARLMDVTHFYNLQEILVQYRWFGNNTSSRMNDLREEAAANISLELSGKYPAYHRAATMAGIGGTRFRLRLFGFIPLLKVKNNWLLLFECIPVFKIKWK